MRQLVLQVGELCVTTVVSLNAAQNLDTGTQLALFVSDCSKRFYHMVKQLTKQLQQDT